MCFPGSDNWFGLCNRGSRGVSHYGTNEGYSVWSPGFSRSDAVSSGISWCFEPPSRGSTLPAKAGTPYSAASPRLLPHRVITRSYVSGLARIFHKATKGAGYGVPALAGQTRFGHGSPSISSRLQRAAAYRLKPGLHTPQQAFRILRASSLASSQHAAG